MREALWACRNLPAELRGAHAKMERLRASLEAADYEGAAVEALSKIDSETARIARMEARLKLARQTVLEGVIRLPATEAEIVAAFYLARTTIADIARQRRCSDRYVKRCKARAVKRLTQ